MRQPVFVFLCASLVMGALSGCAYTTRNALPPRIKTIAVPMFQNKTYVQEYTRKLEVQVTEAVRNAIIQAGELKLTNREDADLVLEGDVTDLDRETVRADRFAEAIEVRLVIHAKISVYDVKEAKYMLKDLLVANTDKKSESGVFNIQRGEYEGLGLSKAMEDIGRVIARHVTERWPVEVKHKPE